MEIFIKIHAEKTNRFESHSFLSVECKVWNIGVRAHDIPIIAMLLQSCLALITRLVTFDIIILSYDSFIMSPLCYSNLNSDDKSFYLIVQTSGKSFGVRNQSITGETEVGREGRREILRLCLHISNLLAAAAGLELLTFLTSRRQLNRKQYINIPDRI